MARPDPALMAECMAIALNVHEKQPQSGCYSVVLKALYVLCDQTDNTASTSSERDREVVEMAGIRWLEWYDMQIYANAAAVLKLINEHYPEG